MNLLWAEKCSTLRKIIAASTGANSLASDLPIISLRSRKVCSCLSNGRSEMFHAVTAALSTRSRSSCPQSLGKYGVTNSFRTSDILAPPSRAYRILETGPGRVVLALCKRVANSFALFLSLARIDFLDTRLPLWEECAARRSASWAPNAYYASRDGNYDRSVSHNTFAWEPPLSTRSL